MENSAAIQRTSSKGAQYEPMHTGKSAPGRQKILTVSQKIKRQKSGKMCIEPIEHHHFMQGHYNTGETR